MNHKEQVRRNIEQNKPTIIRLYKQGVPLTRIQRMTGANYKTVSNYLVDWGLKKPMKTSIDPHKDWIITNYLNRKLSVESMAKTLKVQPSTISNALRTWGIDRKRGFYRKKTEIINNNKQQIINLYTKQKWTTAQIAKKYRLASCTIQLKLKEWGVPARSYQKAEPNKVLQLYKSGLTPEEIAKRCDTDSGTVYKTLRYKLGIKHTKKVKFTPKEDELIKELHSNQLSVPIITWNINKKFNKNISETIVRRRLKELGLKTTYNVITKKRRRNNKPYTKEEKESFVWKIKTMRRDATPIQEIAEKLGIGPSLVASLIKEHKIPKTNKIFTLEIKRSISNLYQSGLHYREIARRLGLNQESVRKELSRIGFNRSKSPFSKSYQGIIREKQNELIKKFYAKRPYYASATAIAKALRLDTTTVRARLREMGIRILSSSELRQLRQDKLKFGKKPKRITITRSTRRFLEENQ